MGLEPPNKNAKAAPRETARESAHVFAREIDGVELFDGRAITGDLAALARRLGSDRKQLRAEALALIRTSFNAAREQIKLRVEAGVTQGLAAARALSALQDVAIQVIYDLATKHFFVAQSPESERISIAATGGYGRGLLAPGSDIDLLFIRPYKHTAWSESVIEFVLYMLWDLGLKVGHATRTRAESVRLAKQDITIRTALLESRYLWGDSGLYSELRASFWKEIAAGTGTNFAEAKLAERDERHLRQGESRYLVEPNLKEGKGGLRDLQTLYWIGKYIYRVEDAADLVDHGVFTKDEYKIFQKAEAFLWDVRCHLHYVAGRAEERLSFDVQPELAKRMGYSDPEAHRAVERFMRQYFLVAKDVGDLTRIFCAALEEQSRHAHGGFIARITPRFLKRRASSEDFFLETARLRAREGIFRDDPVNLIRLFAIADEKTLDIHPATLKTVTRSLDLINDDLRYDPGANAIFRSIMTSRKDPETALRRMNEAGVLGRFLPEFGRVVALMQFNMYHHYTVDEHHLRALGNIAQIERGELKKDHPLASDVIKRIKSRDVLYLAILLHDIAKGLPGDHSKVGAAIAEAVAPRLGMTPEEISLVSWLVLNHLFMSDTAQKRDLSDPKTVQKFVQLVQTPERLRLLLILTVADIRAVGPGVWNGWKGQLLRELYLESEALMSGGDSTPARGARIDEAKEALAKRVVSMSTAQRERALLRHYDPYWLAFDTDAQEFHARLAADADSKNERLAVGARDHGSVTEIVVYTADHPGLFSRLAGAIAVTGGSIVDAKIFTTSDGFALDVFYVQDAEGGTFGDATRIARLKQTIGKTLSGQILPHTVFAKRTPPKRAAAFKIRPRVIIDNDASMTATVIEIESPDRPGLLFDVTRVFFEAGLGIGSAIVATYGERAVDVFYVRDGLGQKVIDTNRLAALEQRLLKVMGKAAEANLAAE